MPGHEIGHCIAHSTNREFSWAFSASQSDNTPNKRAYAMACEFTADRFGLLACRNLGDALKLEMQTSAGRAATSLHFDTDAYLKQCQALAAETLARGGNMLGQTHPEHYFRGYAEWLFSESDVYAAITGAGPGTRTLAEVDAILAKLLQLPERASTGSGAASQKSVDGPRATTAIATVGNLDDERALQRAMPAVGLEDLATDILTDGARRKLVAAGNALSNAARAVAPSLRRLSDAARDHFGATSSPAKIDAPAPEEPDLLDEERNELLARFEELERNAKE